jgi:hypothetical protein
MLTHSGTHKPYFKEIYLFFWFSDNKISIRYIYIILNVKISTTQNLKKQGQRKAWHIPSPKNLTW